MNKTRDSIRSPSNDIEAALNLIRPTRASKLAKHTRFNSIHDFSFRQDPIPAKQNRYARVSINRVMSTTDSNKENAKETLNRTEPPQKSRRRSNTSKEFSQFTNASLHKTASIVNKTVIEYYISFCLAKESLKKLGIIELMKKKGTKKTHRLCLVSEMNSSIR